MSWTCAHNFIWIASKHNKNKSYKSLTDLVVKPLKNNQHFEFNYQHQAMTQTLPETISPHFHCCRWCTCRRVIIGQQVRDILGILFTSNGIRHMYTQYQYNISTSYYVMPTCQHCIIYWYCIDIYIDDVLIINYGCLWSRWRQCKI